MVIIGYFRGSYRKIKTGVSFFGTPGMSVTAESDVELAAIVFHVQTCQVVQC